MCQYVPNMNVILQSKLSHIQVKCSWFLNAVSKRLPETYMRKTAWIPNYCVEEGWLYLSFSAGASGHMCRMTGVPWTDLWNQDCILLQIMCPVTCKILILWTSWQVSIHCRNTMFHLFVASLMLDVHDVLRVQETTNCLVSRHRV